MPAASWPDAPGASGKSVVSLAGSPRRRRVKPASARHDRGFEQEAVKTADRLQEAYQRLLQEVPQRTARASDLQKAIEVDAKLAWQIFRFAQAPSALSASANLPGAHSTRRFLEAAANNGVSRATIDGVAEAYAVFEELVRRRAGSRASYNVMVGGDGRVAQSAAHTHKKAVFRAAAHFLGVQADAYVVTQVVHPGSEPGERDLATIVYKLGLRRLRPDVTVYLGSVGPATEPVVDQSQFQPLDAEGAPETLVSLIPKYCSKQGCETLLLRGADGSATLQLASEAVGTAGSGDWAMGTVQRNADVGKDGHAKFGADVTAAVETLVLDVLVHESLDWKPQPRVLTHIVGTEPTEFEQDRNELGRLNVPEAFEPIGRGRNGLFLDVASRYSDLIDEVCGHLGWKLDQFRTSRCRVAYPIVGSNVSLFFKCSP